MPVCFRRAAGGLRATDDTGCLECAKELRCEKPTGEAGHLVRRSVNQFTMLTTLDSCDTLGEAEGAPAMPLLAGVAR